MLWRSTRKQHLQTHKPSLASCAEVESAFDTDSEILQWLAWIITDNEQVALQCVAEARKLSSEQSEVFSDWLAQWARSSTIQRAIAYRRSDIISASHNYEKVQCMHGGHAALTLREIECLRMTPVQIPAELDLFARAVMLLRGVQHCTLQDCAQRLGCTLSAVVAASCASDQWAHARGKLCRDTRDSQRSD